MIDAVRRLIFVAVVLLYFEGILWAQDDAELTPIMSFTDVFADDAELVQQYSILNYDNNMRLLYYLDRTQSGWDTVAYPEALKNVSRIESRSDGTYILYPFNFPFDRRNIGETWIFDPVERNFMPASTACRLVKALPGEGGWILYRNPDTDLVTLCWTETGEFEPLPENMQWRLCPSYSDPLFSTLTAKSPGGDWVIFMDCKVLSDISDEDVEYDWIQGYEVYAFNVDDKQLNYLGETQTVESISVIDWLDDTTALIYGTTLGTQHNRDYYLADIEKPGSLELVASQYISNPQFYTDPPRYVWVLPNSQGWGEEDDSLIEIPGNIIEYNLETRHQRVLLNKGCEWWLSECTAVPNNTGGSQLSDPTLIAVQEWPIQSDLPVSVKIYAVNTGDIVYETTGHDLTWITADTFLIFGSDRIITLNNEIVEEKDLNIFFYAENPLSPDDQRLLILEDILISYAPSVYYVSSEQTLSILSALDGEKYEIRAEWQDTDLLDVVLIDRQRSDYAVTGQFMLGRWLVRVPAGK